MEKIKKHLKKHAIKWLFSLYLINMLNVHTSENPISMRFFQKSAKKYIKNNLAEVIAEQEKKLGIKYSSIPEIKYDIPLDSCGNFRKGINSTYTRGAYDPKRSGSIYLSTKTAKVPGRLISNFFIDFLSFGRSHDIKQTLNHELGHFYSHGIDNTIFSKKELGYKDKLVLEGIAEYFRISSEGGGEMRPVNIHNNVYREGYNLVKPILDSDFNRGIEYLLENVPNISHKSPSDYQKKALDTIESEN